MSFLGSIIKSQIIPQSNPGKNAPGSGFKMTITGWGKEITFSIY